jgi:hypothetical protein
VKIRENYSVEAPNRISPNTNPRLIVIIKIDGRNKTFDQSSRSALDSLSLPIVSSLGLPGPLVRPVCPLSPPLSTPLLPATRRGVGSARQAGLAVFLHCRGGLLVAHTV